MDKDLKQNRDTRKRLLEEMDQAEEKAWKALAGYKFTMFGYWSGIWVHLNKIARAHKPNPWSKLVLIAGYDKRGR